MTDFTKAAIAGAFFPAMMPIHTTIPTHTSGHIINWHRCHPIIPSVPPYVARHRLNSQREPMQAGMMRQPEHKLGLLTKLKNLVVQPGELAQLKKVQFITPDADQYHAENHTDTKHSFAQKVEDDLLALYTPDATSSVLWQQNPDLSLDQAIATKTQAFSAKSTEAFFEKTLTYLNEAHDILCYLKNRPQREEDIAFTRKMTNQFVSLQAKVIHIAHRYACDYWMPTLIQSITPEQINQLFEMASHDEDVAHWLSQFLVAIAYLSNSELSALSTNFLNKALSSGVMISPIYQAPSEGKPPSTANLGYLSYAHNHMMLSLAGTQPCTLSKNLIAHLQFWKGENDLHQGYHQYTQSVIKPSIQPVLNELMLALKNTIGHNTSHPIQMSYAGHSLGASVAAVLAVEQWLSKESNLTPQHQFLHINSAARAGGDQVHAELQKNQVRLYSSTNEHDIVFQIPPTFIGFVSLTNIQEEKTQNVWHELQHQASALYQNVGESFVRHEITTTLFITPPEKIMLLQQQMGLWTLPPAIQTPDLLGYRTKI